MLLFTSDEGYGNAEFLVLDLY